MADDKTQKMPAVKVEGRGGSRTTRAAQPEGGFKQRASQGVRAAQAKVNAGLKAAQASLPQQEERPGDAPVRQVHLTLSRFDPWSVMKLSFLCAVALGVATVFATVLLWTMVDAIGLWDRVQKVGMEMNGGKPVPILEYFQLGKIMSFSILLAVMNTVIVTALCTLASFVYNLIASLIGGLRVTFTDE
ncbi:DUF3566 domain-containing protein [Dermabacteraceae bacterium P13115]|nr:DUF3566 domain-containing protein [Dermabacteraceae bacterium TAE3-ERU5]